MPPLFGEILTTEEVPLGGGALTGEWRFSTTTTIADPGSGNFRYDSGVIGSVTQIAIAQFTNTGFDAQNILAAIGVGSRLYIQSEDSASEFGVWDVVGTLDNGGWWTIDVTPVATGDLHSNNQRCAVGVVLS